MIVGFNRARVSNAQAARDHLDRWKTELRELSTPSEAFAGLTEDGEIVMMVRFSTEEEAAAHIASPEQQAQWSALKAFLASPPTPFSGDDVEIRGDEPADDVGFVQVMTGRTTDRAALEAGEREMTDSLQDRMREVHPAWRRSIRLWIDDEHLVEANLFTDEAGARRGEAAMGEDPELSAAFTKRSELLAEVEFLDLADPVVVAG